MLRNTQDVLNVVGNNLQGLPGHIFDVLSVSKPNTIPEAINLSKIISKLSPLVGNLIEYKMVDYLNSIKELSELGCWQRQDPGFPDTVFISSIKPVPGFEIKAWFPLATEITARFKDSQSLFLNNQTNVLIISWLPEFVFYGRPKIIGICNVSGKSIAEARDKHYHKPPYYLVMEPEDTSSRTANLQQTNTNGYVFQDSDKVLQDAIKFMNSLSGFTPEYQVNKEYQYYIQKLFDKYKYRLDTNYAKIDRIQHHEIEKFKDSTLETIFNGLKIKEWAKIIGSDDKKIQSEAFKRYLNID